MTFTVGSLFTGIGGLDLALESLGGVPVWQSEIEPSASGVLAKHWPGVPNLGDIRTVDWSEVERPDIICGGYPCQPFSVAGLRKGEDDPRHLWPAFRDALGVLRPRWVVLENVRGHLSLGFGSVLGDLSSLGYDAEWAVVRASDIGAPHRRERLFVVAADTDERRHGGRESEPAATGRGRQGRVGWSARAGQDVAADAEGHEQREQAEPRPLRAEPRDGGAGVEWGTYAPAVSRWERLTGRTAPHPAPDGRLSPAFVEWMMGFPEGWVTNCGLSRTKQLKALGNAVVPQQGTHAVRGLWT